MSRFIKPEVKALEISGIRQFNDKANSIPGVIKLTLGELDFNTFDHIKDALHKATDTNKTRYTPNAGIPSLRRHIASQYEHYNPEEILVTVGTTEGISIVIKSIIQAGDEVIIPTPGYVGYQPLIQLEQGHVIPLNTLTSNGITKEALLTLLNSNTKAIILTNPNNPTGVVLSKQEMDIIQDVVLEHDLFLIVDEIYASIVFDDSFTSFATYQKLKNQMVILNGYSKSHALTGLRVGYVLSDKNIIQELTKTHQYNVSSTSSLSQFAALATKPSDTSSFVSELLIRRDFVLSMLDQLNLPYIFPQGAFYVFVNITEFALSSVDFAEQLLLKYKVAVIPGSAFLGDHNDYIRISYATNINSLGKALNRLKEYVTELRDKI